jgi:hypothetical protein
VGNGNPAPHNPNGVSLREHIETKINDMDRRIEQKFTSLETALRAALTASQLAGEKAEQSNKEWKEAANEWRAAMSDKDKLFATKSEVMGHLDRINGALEDLKTVRDMAIGKASQNSVIGAYVIAAIGIAITIVRAFIK